MSMELGAKEMFMLFPTPLFTGKLLDLSACDRIEKNLRDMQKLGAGMASQAKAAAYMTPDNLQNNPDMKELTDLVMAESNQVLDAFKIKRDSHYIANMWGNITHPNHRHHMHVHPNCLLSGIMYIKTPANCGPTMFASPRQLSRMMEPDYTAKNEINSDVFIFPAEKGRMLMWPSYLPHAVEHGTANEDEDRIVVAFNVMIRATVEQLTMRMAFA
jgi:uncharacterized protein (TIGR02466 family)